MSIAKKLTVYSVNLNDMKKTKLAHFELQGDHVKATFESSGFENTIKRGLYDRGKAVTVKDGERFMQVLETAYSRSSTISVERG